MTALYGSDGKLLGDIYSITATTYGIAELTLPYPEDCVGATIRIMRRANIVIKLYLKDYNNRHEDSFLVLYNAFYCLQQFEWQASGGARVNEQHHLEWDTYNEVELISTLNPSSPEYTSGVYNYVWMVVGAR